MSNIYTSNKLIKSIKRRAMLPNDQNTFEDTDFLEIANEEIDYFAVPHLLSTYEEYLVVDEDFALEENKKSYAIPHRAIGNKLRDAAFVDIEPDINGVPKNEVIYELSRISLEDLADYRYGQTSDYSNVFYVKDNSLVLLDDFPVQNASLRMSFYLKPNNLVLEERAGIITAIDTVNGVITLSTFPDNFANIPDMDFIMKRSPNKIYKYDITPQSVNSNTKSVTFDPDDLPDDLVVGDYLCQAGETIVLQLPEELHAIVAQRVAVACLEALGDSEGLKNAQTRLEMMERSTLSLIDNRVEGAPQKIRKRHGSLRDAIGARWGSSRSGRGI